MENTAQAGPKDNKLNAQTFPSLFSLIPEALKVYKLKWKKLLEIYLTIYASVVAPAIVAILLLISAGRLIPLTKNHLIFLIFTVAVAIAAICFAIYFVSWSTAASIIILRDRREALGFREIFRRAKPYIIPYIFVSIASCAVIALGFLFFVIPGIIFSVWLIASSYIIFFGNERGFEILSKSREYARGYFWKIFRAIALGTIAFSIIDAAIQPLNNSGYGRIIYYLVSFFIAPISAIYYYLIFDHLRKIKGDVLATTSNRLKTFLKSLTAIGIILAVIALALLVYFEPQIKNAYDYYQIHRNSPVNSSDPKTIK